MTLAIWARVIGLGTPIGDDAAGLELADRVGRMGLPRGVQVVRCERPLDLVDWLCDVDAALLLDAVRSDRAPGTLHHVRLDALHRASSVSTHAVGVAEALALADALGRLPARLEIVGIEVDPRTLARGAGLADGVRRGAVLADGTRGRAGLADGTRARANANAQLSLEVERALSAAARHVCARLEQWLCETALREAI